MKVFQCGNCNHPLFFENTSCQNCGHICGYLDSRREMLTFAFDEEKLISDRARKQYKYCHNHSHGVCNWLIPVEEESSFCSACQLNRTIPNLSEKENHIKWRNLEVAKHRLVYQLQKMGLPTQSKLEDENGLCFDFIEKQNNPQIMTGHSNGIITILLSEADSVLREQRRKQLLEPYRTLIGHLRHEVGHYYWDKLIFCEEDKLREFRSVFGDEREDYAEALEKYYAKALLSNWSKNHISKYATAHPWEDWAETWAHYLHVMEMVETAHYFGLRIKPIKASNSFQTKVSFDPYFENEFEKIVQTCVALTLAANSINRSMGIPDVYPFEINALVISKMNFIHHLILDNRTQNKP